MAETGSGRPFGMPKWLKVFFPAIIAIIILFFFSGVPTCFMGEVVTRDTLNNSAYQKIHQGDFDGAISDLNEAIKRDPNYTVAYYNRGTAKMEKEDYAGAAADFEKAIELKTRMEEVHNNLGLARLNSGDYDGALIAFDESIRLKSDNINAYHNRGLAHEHKGDIDKAIEDFKATIFINKEFAPGFYNWARMLAKKGDKKGMLEKLEKVIEFYHGSQELLKEDEDFKEFHDDPEFKKLVESNSE
jgi:tetratricopeptide (TPR) repeat protein